MTTGRHAGVLGATSLVGECLLPLLADDGWDVAAFSRRAARPPGMNAQPVHWQVFREPVAADSRTGGVPEKQIPHWVCLAPIWVLPDYFSMLSRCGARHVVALSSTSRWSRGLSSDAAERALGRRLAESEERLIRWAEIQDATWTILRPTLIYGLGRDENISVIARFVRRFGFFPLLGAARGLRQPVHAQDVARGCLAALTKPEAANRCYDLSGGEALAYREMIARVFSALGRKPRFVRFPLWVFRLTVAPLRLLPTFSHWSVGMAERMNQDLAFDYSEASRDFGFSPRPFRLTRQDLPA
jgi:uncharacterized protein YbjT (DUF2867 family)